MNPATNLPRRLATAERRIGRALDALLEARNNVERREWFFAESNLRGLCRNCALIARERRALMRLVRAARKEGR